MTSDLTTEGRIVFSPKELSESNESETIVHGTWISNDGQILIYGSSDESYNNNNFMTLGLKDLSNNSIMSDTIRNCLSDRTSVSWLDKEVGFFYTTVSEELGHSDEDRPDLPGHVSLLEYDETDKAKIVFLHRLYFHRLGTEQSEDLLIFQLDSSHDNIQLNTIITSDGHFLLIEIHTMRISFVSQLTVIPENCSDSNIGNKVYCFDLSKFTGRSISSIGKCLKLVNTD